MGLVLGSNRNTLMSVVAVKTHNSKRDNETNGSKKKA